VEVKSSPYAPGRPNARLLALVGKGAETEEKADPGIGTEKKAGRASATGSALSESQARGIISKCRMRMRRRRYRPSGRALRASDDVATPGAGVR
jgi:hypothetical protein